MTKNKITDFLPKKPETKLVQGVIPGHLKDAVAVQMKKDKQSGQPITWDSLLEAAARAYLAERGAS
jgi:hypothetical protein